MAGWRVMDGGWWIMDDGFLRGDSISTPLRRARFAHADELTQIRSYAAAQNVVSRRARDPRLGRACDTLSPPRAVERCHNPITAPTSGGSASFVNSTC